MFSNNDSTLFKVESWFIPLDIVKIICTGFVVVLSLILSIVIVFDRTRRTVSAILVLNSFLSELMFGSVMCSMAIFSLYNDIRHIHDQDHLCIFRGYLSYAISAVRSHSYLLQSLYRYMTVAHPNHPLWQSIKFQSMLICLTWLLSLLHPFPFLFTNQITYNLDNQVCHMPLTNYPYIFYTCFVAYLYPVASIGVIYMKLVRYTKSVSQMVTPVNHIVRAQRELKMVRRIVTLVCVLVTLGLPYTIFFVSAFFTEPFRYHFRIAFLSVDVSLLLIIIALFQFNDPVKTFVTRKINQVFTIGSA